MLVAGIDDVLEFLFALSWTFSQFTSVVLDMKTCLMPASYCHIGVSVTNICGF
jgi:hypothetical protein